LRVEIQESIWKEAGFGSPFSFWLPGSWGCPFLALFIRYRIGTIRQKFPLATPAVSE
jgi:hypothetical protein